MIQSQGRARLTMFLALLALVGIAVKFFEYRCLALLASGRQPRVGTDQQLRCGPLWFSLHCR
jgi:hypothetical protein